MQKIIFAFMATLAVTSAGGLTGFSSAQYTQHAHAAVVSHHAVAAPIVHHHVAAPSILHHHVAAAPAPQVVRAIHHTAPVHASVSLPAYYQSAAVLPSAYASTYSHRAPAARVIGHHAVAHPVTYAHAHPVVGVATAYAPSYHTYARAPVAVHHAVAAPIAVGVHHAGTYSHHGAIFH